MSVVHVIGAGMAGLAASVALARRGTHVHLYEASGHAGGRCRSFHDTHLDRTIDNGNHLVLSGNRAVARYLQIIGASDRFAGPAHAAFFFVDVRSNERWCVRPNRGPFPWWVFSRNRRIPGTAAMQYARMLRIATARPHESVNACVGNAGVLYERFLQPLAVGALNTPANEGSARLLWSVLRETFAKGERYCRPLVARQGLTEALVRPALAFLRGQGARVHLSHRLQKMETRHRKACTLEFKQGCVALDRHDQVILALPPWAVASLLPELTVPHEHCAIINAHYLLQHPVPAQFARPIVGIIGGTAQWVFLRKDVASVTISAAESLIHIRNTLLTRRIWPDVAQALGLPVTPAPTCRIIKEKRATFRQSPENLLRRPKTASTLTNVLLAGDWTDTGLPATIEGAVRSGFSAARTALTQRLPKVSA